jgi:hypothetical protein
MFGEWFFGSDPEFNQQCKDKSREFADFRKEMKRSRSGLASVEAGRPVTCLLFMVASHIFLNV